MNNNCRAYFRSALQLGLPVTQNEIIDGFTLKLGGRKYRFFGSTVPVNDGASTLVCSDKFVTNRVLRQMGVPCPKASFLDSADFDYHTLYEAVRNLKFPLVVKPQNWSSLGCDVNCNIPNFTVLYDLCQHLFKWYPSLSFEEFHPNLNGYRVLVHQNKILEVIERFPSTVVGDGKLTIERLVEKENRKRRKTKSFLEPILQDFEFEQALFEQKLNLWSVPEEGQKVVLGYTCNASRGGTIKTYTSGMCSENKKMFINIAKEFNLSLAGIDVHCVSLHVPIREGNGVVLEVNYNPSVRIHEEGLGGTTTQVTKIVMRSFIYKHPLSYALHAMRTPQLKSYFFKVFGGFAVLLALSIFIIGNFLGMI